MGKPKTTPDHPYLNATALPQVLRHWRQEHQVKIQTAAVELGVSMSAWGHWETGTRFPQGRELLRLASYTGIPLAELICPHNANCPCHQVNSPARTLP